MLHEGWRTTTSIPSSHNTDGEAGPTDPALPAGRQLQAEGLLNRRCLSPDGFPRGSPRRRGGGTLKGNEDVGILLTGEKRLWGNEAPRFVVHPSYSPG